MEPEEFRELALQSLPKLSRGRTVRYTLVRTPGEFFINKIHRQQYLDLRSIPLVKNYRFIQSSLTHSEYASFKEDFTGDLDFLRISGKSFSSIIDTASDMGFSLYGFSSSGNGRIEVKSPGKGLGPEDITRILRDNEEKGIRPFLLTFSRNNHRITIRKDFNFFLHGGFWEALDFIYRVSVRILEENRDLLDRLSSLRIRWKRDPEAFCPLEPITYRVRSGASAESIMEGMRKNFDVGVIRGSASGASLYVFQKTGEGSVYRVDVQDGRLDFLPTSQSGMEGALELIEAIEGEGSL